MFKCGEMLENKYEIIEHIGTGGGGIVYKAYQHGLGRYVAIKLIKDEVSGVLDNHAEADILKNLKHTFVPAVYDFIESDGKVYTVMEFIDGKSLQKLLDEGHRFSGREILKYTRQLCEAAAYLHSRKPPVIHSDIKPANIMLTAGGDICLIDYNISLIINRNANAVGVSDGYSPPEQYAHRSEAAAVPDSADNDDETVIDDSAITLIDDETQIDSEDDYTKTLIDNTDNTEDLTHKDPVSGNAAQSLRNYSSAAKSAPAIDKRSDVYAIGATVYHLAAGHRPAVSTGAVTPIDPDKNRISESLAFIINKAMEKDPAKRFSGAEQMLKAVNNLRRYDKRYKAMLLRQEIAVIAVIAAMVISCLMAVSGYLRTGSEALEKYDLYISEMENTDENTDAYIELYEKAAALFPKRSEAYEAMAYSHYDSGDYNKTEEYINNVISLAPLYIGDNEESYSLDKLYHLLGRCYLETEDYGLAVSALEKAVSLDGSKDEYYCDYAAALARNGQTEKAEEILEIAEKKGLSDANVLFVRGEIEYALGNYSTCAENIRKCISLTQDDDILYRAYVIGANACAKGYANGTVTGSERIDLANSAIKGLPIDKTMPFYEMLAAAYIDEAQASGNSACYSDAISTYETMNSLGWETADSDYSLIRLYRIIGNYGYAKRTAEELLADNSEDYTLYKLLAYVESDIQSEKNVTERDYSDFCTYYEKALSLCTDENDFEMQRLKEAYEKIKG
jgi:serine/threonine-protein kinase